MSSSRAATALALGVLVLAVFAQVRHHEFVDFDDLIRIAMNRDLRVTSPGEALRVAVTSRSQASWVPLTMLSLQLDHALYGTRPGGYLLTNVALHAAASITLFFALAALTGAHWRSAFVAGVFAVHPLHVESVAWASERKDVLSGLFWMLTLLAYAHYVRAPDSRARYAAVLLSLVLGLLAKPMLVTLPFALLLLDYWPLRRLGRRAWLEKLPMFALVAAIAAATVWMQRAVGATWFGERIPLGDRLMNAVDSYARYLGASFWPAGLAAFYEHPVDGLAPGRVAALGSLLVGVSGLAWALRRSRPYLLVGWLWFLGTLVPVIGLVQVGLQARADRYMYLPMLGLAIALAWAVGDAARSPLGRRAAAAAGGLALAALALLAWVQVGYWRDSVTLFERVLAVEPNSSFAHGRLAPVHLRAGRLDSAEHHYRRLFELAPQRGRSKLVHFHLGMADLTAKRGDREAAVDRYHAALELDPENARAHALLGIALVGWNRPLEARPHLEEALRRNAEGANLHAALAAVAQAEGRRAEALAHEAAAQAAAGRPDDAVASAEQALAQAESGGDAALAQRIRKSLAKYRAQQPSSALPAPESPRQPHAPEAR